MLRSSSAGTFERLSVMQSNAINNCRTRTMFRVLDTGLSPKFSI